MLILHSLFWWNFVIGRKNSMCVCVICVMCVWCVCVICVMCVWCACVVRACDVYDESVWCVCVMCVCDVCICVCVCVCVMCVMCVYVCVVNNWQGTLCHRTCRAPLQNNFIYTKTQTTKIFVIQTTNYSWSYIIATLWCIVCGFIQDFCLGRGWGSECTSPGSASSPSSLEDSAPVASSASSSQSGW